MAERRPVPTLLQWAGFATAHIWKKERMLRKNGISNSERLFGFQIITFVGLLTIGISNKNIFSILLVKIGRGPDIDGKTYTQIFKWF